MATVPTVSAEARERVRYAPVAVLAGVLLIAGAAIQLGGPHAKVNEETLGLITVSRRGSIDIIGAVINGIALGLIAVALNFLYRLTKARQPAAGSYLRVLAIAGGVVTGVLGIAYAIVVHAKAHQFVTQGNQTYLEAKHLTQGVAFTALPTIELAAALALAMAFVLLSLGAMRVGLLTRFMGYLGIFTGVLVLFPIGSPVPVVEGFWLIALGVLFAGRWPSGMPLSWSTGKAEPWPSSQELREQRIRAAGTRRGQPAGKPAPGMAPRLARKTAQGRPAAAENTPAKAAAESPTPRAGQKRKRKRRR
jgi:hypothetical protein